MNKELLKTAIRQNAIFISNEVNYIESNFEINETTSVLLANANKLGFTFSEKLLYKINNTLPTDKLRILNVLKEITGVNINWTPLVKQWNIPTGESVLDHIATFFHNVFQSDRGTELECGHLIPFNTFPLERYNGCPFCGTPFEFEKLEYSSENSKLKVLKLWNENDLQKYMTNLLASSVVLDATQIDSLKILIKNFEIPSDIEIGIKETLMILIDLLIEQNKADIAGTLFKNPNDILRYLWYKHTGFLQIIEPKTIIKRLTKNARSMQAIQDASTNAKLKPISDLKLKFSRQECKQYALWLNGITLNTKQQCEIMHPKRGMWVRVIRALRLSEYSKIKGFENLSELLDVFYNEKYEVWQAKVNHFKLKNDAKKTFNLLKQRPSLFARSLFSNMLWFGKEITIKHFKEVMFDVPARLIYTLNMYAENYFNKNSSRNIKTLGGTNKLIPANKMLQLYSDDELKSMKSMIQDLSLDIIKKRFEDEKNLSKTIYIEKELHNIPISIGDRSDSIQDLPSALQGTRFSIEGNKVRLFLQWGEGLSAQHLDMDLSCSVSYENKSDFCSYSQLVIPGCKHSGDIQRIPEKVGTAEYIDINLDELNNLGAKFVSFTCNAYTSGNLSPNLVVGWMNSKYPMKISKKGVAYNPADVQHQIRMKGGNMAKGLVFGILDIKKREIIWLEMSFGGQIVQKLDTAGVEALLNKLDAKLKIGALLKLKAEIQNLIIVDTPTDADDVYDTNWALDIGNINKLFLE